MEKLKHKLETLCIFRDMLQDTVVSALVAFLQEPSASAYAEFVSRLYLKNGGNLGRYILELCEGSENVYVKMQSRHAEIPLYLQETFLAELDTLQTVAEITPEKLRSMMDYEGTLPLFSSEHIAVKEQYWNRVQNIGQCGYGIYAKHVMFSVNENNEIVPVMHPDATVFSQLADYHRERNILMDNTIALLAGKPAANVLLTGDAGTGKSSSIKAVVNSCAEQGLRLVEIHMDQLHAIPKIIDHLSDNPLKFILFIDDISFAAEDCVLNMLKAVLEGSVTSRPDNIVIYATSNRRHIVKEKFSDREGDDVHRNDSMQELFSLSERFGIHIHFSKPDKKTFLHIVNYLAEQNQITLPQDELESMAERYALERGGRSARLARQFINHLQSKI
ncbi:MAG: ATP-binding protein [Oscillospiraceae bacterium]|nr:ATP-binding protein [Oscillospiraceae bacterium]